MGAKGSTVNPLICKICGMGFNNIFDYQAHGRDVHNRDQIMSDAEVAALQTEKEAQYAANKVKRDKRKTQTMRETNVGKAAVE